MLLKTGVGLGRIEMSEKPIEPGCLAVVMNTDVEKFMHMIGKSVIVIDEVTDSRFLFLATFTDPTVGTFWNVEKDGEIYKAPEKWLKRIDGYEDLVEMDEFETLEVE